MYSERPVASTAGSRVILDAEAAHHLRVRRVREGERVGVTDGRGGLAEGVLDSLGRNEATVEVVRSELVERQGRIHLLAPVGDRDRMLWLAEKATELELTGWQPVRWQRSRSVSPRGEGEGFRVKVRARMVSALLQSGGAWLPDVLPESEPETALAGGDGHRVVLHMTGPPFAREGIVPPVSVALGPEGGLEDGELELATSMGWRFVSLGRSVLRFETAGVVALGMLRGG